MKPAFWPRVRVVALSAVILLFAFLGLSSLATIADVETAGQLIVAIGRVGYGIAAIAVLWALVRRSKWLMLAVLVWGAAMSLTETAAPIVLEDARWTGALLSGILTALIAWVVGRACDAHVRSARRSKFLYVSYYR